MVCMPGLVADDLFLFKIFNLFVMALVPILSFSANISGSHLNKKFSDTRRSKKLYAKVKKSILVMENIESLETCR